jgi:AbrB family looped-hinge helix DNA binding protein
MSLRVDKAGRLVRPKSVRSRLGITPDTTLELVHRADGVLLRRVAERPSMQQVDGL